MNCPGDNTPLWPNGTSNHDYHCPVCRTHWTIVPYIDAPIRFNRRAPYAQLVIDIDKALHPKHTKGHAA